jgi:hypothetical protein
MKKLLLGVFVGLLILGVTAPVWALEVSVGGEFRFRGRDRTDFDLQSFNRNSGNLQNKWNGLSGLGTNIDLFLNDAPVGAATYGGSTQFRGSVQKQFAFPGTASYFNVATGQFGALPAVPVAATAYRDYWFDGSAAEENFGYSYINGLLNPLRSASRNYASGVTNYYKGHRYADARPHADTGNNDRDYFYDRIRVSVDAKIVDGLRAYAMFENYSDWGLGTTSVTNASTLGGGDGSTSTYGDRQSMNIRFAWVDFVIPMTPVHVKMGRQPLALGHGMLLDTRTWGGDMVYAYAPMGPVTVGGFYGKFAEGNRSNADDAYFVGGNLDFAINPANKVSTFYRYVNSRVGRYFNLLTPATQPISIPANTTGSFAGGAVARNHAFTQEQHGWGLTADGKVGPIFYAAEVDVLWGKYINWVENRKSPSKGFWDYANARTPLQFQEDLYQAAWGAGGQLGVDLKFVQIDFAASYGSGDKTRAASQRFQDYAGGAGERFGQHQWTTGRRVEGFDAWGSDNVYSPWTTDIFLASAKSANFGNIGLGTQGFTRRWNETGDFGSVFMVKPTLKILPFDNLTVDVSYAAFWKTDHANSNGAGMGAVQDGEFGNIVLWKANANNAEQPNKQRINNFLGQEIDAHVVYYPYKNLMIKGWGAIFMPGEWFEVKQRSNNGDIPGTSSGAGGHDQVHLKPAWALQLDVIVTF